MKPFILLLVVTLVALVALRIVKGGFEWAWAARIGMGAMLLFATLGHFMFPEGMSQMIPDFIPFKKELVYITAFFEIAAAIGLQFQQLQLPTAWLLILFFVLVLPANIYAAMNQLNYQTGTLDGPGISYLWFRIPLQLVFIVWVYFSSIKVNLGWVSVH